LYLSRVLFLCSIVVYSDFSRSSSSFRAAERSLVVSREPLATASFSLVNALLGPLTSSPPASDILPTILALAAYRFSAISSASLAYLAASLANYVEAS
jgi:hypothetical protein